MLLFAKARGRLFCPRGRELAAACFSGFLTLGMGTGALVFSEVLIPSGIAGLITSISPFWIVGAEALLPGGERLHAPTLGGMAVGLAGAALLFTPDSNSHGFNRALSGMLILQVGGGVGVWLDLPAPPCRPVAPRSGGWSPATGGVADTAAVPAVDSATCSALEHARRSGALLPGRFRSLVGYSAYVYAMDRLPVSIVIYPYVNAVVAVFLGWLFYREPFGSREMVAMVIIFGGVAIVKKYSKR